MKLTKIIMFKQILSFFLLLPISSLGLCDNLIKEINSRSFKVGSCFLILQQDKMISDKNIEIWRKVAREIEGDPKAKKHYESLWDGLQSKNAESMFRMSSDNCSKLGYTVK